MLDNWEIPGKKIIQLSDVIGNILLMKRVKDQNRIEMDVSSQSNGIYLLKILTGEGVEVKKLLIR